MNQNISPTLFADTPQNASFKPLDAPTNAEPSNRPIPPRPSQNDDYVMERAALLALPEVQEWLKETDAYNAGEDSDTIKELASAFKYEPSGNGYDRAKHLESHKYWSGIDASLVEILDRSWPYEALQICVADWVRSYNVRPQLEVGAQVTYLDKPYSFGAGTVREGEITDINLERATYTVCVPALGHVKQGSGIHGNVLPFEVVEAPIVLEPVS
jgi:hypothetical protein